MQDTLHRMGHPRVLGEWYLQGMGKEMRELGSAGSRELGNVVEGKPRPPALGDYPIGALAYPGKLLF